MLTTRPLLSVIGTALVTAALVACGGGEPAPGSSGGAPAEASPKVEATSKAPASTSAPSGASTPAGAAASGGSAGNAPPACQLMTKDEAKAALGTDVGEGRLTGGAPEQAAPNVTLTVSVCRYSATTASRSISVGYEQLSGSGIGAMRDQIRRQFDSNCNQKERVNGLGDVACWQDAKHTRLTWLKGTTTVTVQVVQSVSDPDMAAPVKKAAETAASRMQ